MYSGPTTHPVRACVVAVLVATAAGSSSAHGQSATGVDAIVRTVDTDALRGKLTALSLTGGATLRTEHDGTMLIRAADLVRLTMVETAAAPPADKTTLELNEGDWIAGRIVAGGTDAVTVETIALGRVHLPLDAVEGVRTAKASQPAYRGSVAWFERTAAGDSDAVLLTNGDVVSGFVTAIDSDGITIDGSLGEADIPLARTLIARLAPGRPAPLTGPRFSLSVRRTGRLTVTAFDLTGATAEARLRHSEHVSVAASDILAIEVAGGRWEWLSAMQPISFQHTPMLSLGWDHVNDRNVLGKPMVVAGKRYEHGVGVHSRSSLIYDLQGKYATFVTAMGIDDDSGDRADVSVHILVDGKRRFDKQHIKPGALIGPIRTDVAKAKRLELIVDYGANGDIQDRFNWIEPALVR